MAERDWYDRATFGFQIVAATIAGLFTLVQYEKNEIDTQQQSADSANIRTEANRAILTKYLFDAVSQTVSSDPDQRNRGLRLLNLINTDSFFNSLGLDRKKETDLAALLNNTQSYNISTLASTGTTQSTPATKQISYSSCAERLKVGNAAAVHGSAAPDCWIYLGWYKGTIEGGHCKDTGAWATRYLEFDARVCPSDLMGRYLAASERTGALYVRSAPATPFGVAPVVGGLYPKQAIVIDRLSSSMPDHAIDQKPDSDAGQGQLWGRISGIKT
jgi:hypothetical protein